ncbi:GIY-YIG nuclease family protein [Leptolyngbya sp. FACHB-671]|nr:GIY-YIG nuclease family protein [Leptolyngbya sp. FACHB-671]
MSDDQLLLFSPEDLRGYRSLGRQEEFLEMDCVALQSWKQRIFQYQQQVKISPPTEQGTLFDPGLTSSSTQPDPDGINPFNLPQQNTEFWRWKAADQGTAALYFVIDYELPILLYVGETVKSNQRWKGVHDCKRYLLNYRQIHYQHQLTSMLGIAFWAEAPVATRPRQRLESALIYKWRSPFNKENWDFWATPFVGGK